VGKGTETADHRGHVKTALYSRSDAQMDRERNCITSGIVDNEDTQIKDEKLDMPMSYGIGISYRVLDKFTITAVFIEPNGMILFLRTGKGRKSQPSTDIITQSLGLCCRGQQNMQQSGMGILPNHNFQPGHSAGRQSARG